MKTINDLLIAICKESDINSSIEALEEKIFNNELDMYELD